MKQQVLAVVTACALLVSACSAGGTATINQDAAAESDTSVEPTTEATTAAVDQTEPTAVPLSTTVPSPEPAATAAAPTPVPEPPSQLGSFEPGECFNNAGTDGESVPSAPVDCQEEHEYEVFFVGESAEGPEVAYRSGSEFTDGLFADSCDPATIEFAGVPWDLLPFGITVWTPSEADWLAGDRSFACTAEAGLRAENIYKVGTAAGGNLISDEGIVARATLDGQRDLQFSFQGSTVYPLTRGSFELPNLSPHVLGSGFLFASPLQDVDGSTSRGYDFNFETGEVTQLETGLDGWEIASPHFLIEIPAFVFAARETDGDDWDIFLSRTADEVVALADSPLDDHWLTLTPDASQIVYHSGGDIWIMDVDGTNKQQLTNEPANDFESAVSPDGTRIAFASDRSGNDDIWIMNIDGSDPQNLTNHPASEAWPFFSADGSRIYFQTDRLGIRANIMLMELDGSDQSYYSFEFMTNGALLPNTVTTRFAAELPTIAEVLARTVEGIVPGQPGEFTTVEHSTGRLIPMLPAGWEYQEVVENDLAAVVTAPSLSAFGSSWAADGVLITLIEASTEAELLARMDAAEAANDSSCVGGEDSTEVEGTLVVVERRYSCGTASSAIVVGVFNREAQLAVLFEGQWDGDPSNQIDEDLISEIGRLLTWR